MKIGLFGGSFNPPHQGHLSSMSQVKRFLGLHEIWVIPNSQNPLKKLATEGPSPEMRLKMTEAAVATLGKGFKVLDIEIKKGGKSYTLETIQSLKKTNPNDDFYLILGLDQLESFSSWKNPQEILDEVDVVFTSRPGFQLPHEVSELPDFFQKMVKQVSFNSFELMNAHRLEFIQIKDLDASGTEIRRRLRKSQQVADVVPLAVESIINEEKLYRTEGLKIADYEKFAQFCAGVISEKKGISARIFDLRQITAPTDFAVVASGTSTRHASSLAENLMKAVKEQFGIHPLSVEGYDEGRWVLVDYGSLIAHLFYDYVRQEYSLEKLWSQAKEIQVIEQPPREI